MALTAGAGLEGVIAAESEICFIDGDAGILAYQGYDIHTLAENATFEEVVYLLWTGRLPTRAGLDQLKQELVLQRPIPVPVVDFLKTVLNAKPMDVLRTAVSLLGIYDPEAKDNSLEANARKAVSLLARTSTLVSTFDRLRKGVHIIEGDPKLGFAANFLYCLTSKRPDDVMERAFDVALILHADHEFNASTFAGRVTAATLSDIYSAATSAIGALKGPLHGGANEDVIRMLLEAGNANRAVQQVRDRLGLKMKIPGFGHRVYRTEDPRATHLRALSEELGRRTGHLDLYLTSKQIEDAVKTVKGLNPNVDFYSASAYYSLGIPIDLFTPIFAISRMAGWTAHILEQYRNNRLIRPRADYRGAPVGRPWTPIGQR
ncbi:MAG: citrate synthase [Acidobacteria bacterium]|nr:citrate synthase [Acidobacteriota bacterium]